MIAVNVSPTAGNLGACVCVWVGGWMGVCVCGGGGCYFGLL